MNGPSITTQRPRIQKAASRALPTKRHRRDRRLNQLISASLAMNVVQLGRLQIQKNIWSVSCTTQKEIQRVLKRRHLERWIDRVGKTCVNTPIMPLVCLVPVLSHISHGKYSFVYGISALLIMYPILWFLCDAYLLLELLVGRF